MIELLRPPENCSKKNGFAGATTKEIAELAGVSEVTLFRHFSTKRNLFEETVKSCIHPYRLDGFLKDEVKYDLDHDLTRIAYNIMETYKQNVPMLRMIMRDKFRESGPELRVKKNELVAENKLLEYFTTMHMLGKMNAEPKMAIKFYITNIVGYFMREIFAKDRCVNDEKYFAWMLQRVIAVLKSGPQSE